MVTVRLDDGFDVEVEGFGIPYANKMDPQLELWVNNNSPIAHNVTLMDILRQREFMFIVAEAEAHISKRLDPSRLAEPFNYPYGNVHDWDMERYMMQQESLAYQESFLPAYQ